MIVESEPVAWISRLETPGFIQGPGIDVLYLPVASENYFSEALANRLKDLLGSQVYQLQPSQPGGPEATSSLPNSVEHIPLAPPPPIRAVTGSGPMVSFAVTSASTPVSTVITSGHRGSIITAPVSRPAVVQPALQHGSQDRDPSTGGGPGQPFSHSLAAPI